MIAAAALVAAGAASAQTLQAEIPFAFRAGGKVMAAGTYSVDVRGSANIVTISGWNKGGVMAMPTGVKADAESKPKLVFECGHGTCSLLQVWPGYSQDGLVFRTPKSAQGEDTSLAVIPLRRNATE
jgi:hypothetical protein